MDKQKLLELITALAEKKLLSRQEVLHAYDKGTGKKHHLLHFRLSDMLAAVGGAIVFLGVAVLVWQNWARLGSLAQILATLGSGIAAYAAGLSFLQHKTYGRLAEAFFLLSALLLPLGLFVTFREAGYDINEPMTHVVVAGVLTLTFLSSFFLFRTSLFLLFTVFAATWLYYAFTTLLTQGNPLFEPWNFSFYRTLIAGLSYILIGHELQKMGRYTLAGFLQGTGVFAFLLSAILLGHWEPDQSFFWETLSPGLALGAIFLSLWSRVRSFLVFGALFLMINILKLTAEYFQESLGWPVALIAAGACLIIVGFITLKLGKKYFSEE